MAISAQDVKTLREMTGAGFMDCKAALADASGDFDAAVKILREKGQAKAAKKAARTATEGLIQAKVAADAATGLLLEVSCNTDFVARNPEFVGLVDELSTLAADKASTSIEAVRALAFRGKTVAEELIDQTAKIGENIQASRLVRYATNGTAGLVHAYIHPPGKIGVLLRLETSLPAQASSAAVKTLAQDLCLHIAASSPRFLDKTSVDADVAAAERDIYLHQAINEGKPAAIAEKMVEGRMKKFYEEACLLSQPFVKDNDLTVEHLLGKVSKDTGGMIKIAEFARLAVGELAAESADED